MLHRPQGSLLFVFLIGAIVAKTIEHWSERNNGWFKVYAAVAVS